MNKKQIESLEKNGYVVLPEFNMIHKKDLNEPYAHVIYNQSEKQFAVKIAPVEVSGNECIDYYVSILTERLNFIKQLNLLGVENVCN